MKKMAFEWKILLFGKLAVVPFLIGVAWLLVFQYSDFLNSRLDLRDANELQKISQLYRDVVAERGIAMLFLRGRTSIYEFKDGVKKAEEIEKKLKGLGLKFEKITAENIVKLKSLREEIFTQGITPDQAYAGYQEILSQMHQSLSFAFDLPEASVAATSNSLFEDVAALRDLLIQEAIVNMPLSSIDFNKLLEKATRPGIHEKNLLGMATGSIKSALEGWQELEGQKELKRKLDFMIKNSDQGNFKITAEEIYADSAPVLKKLEDVAQLAFSRLLDTLVEREKEKRMKFVSYAIGIFSSCLILGFVMKFIYRHTVYHHKIHLWRSRKHYYQIRGPVMATSTTLISDVMSRNIFKSIQKLQQYPLRYKVAYYNKELDGEIGKKEIENINFDFSSDMENIFDAVAKVSNSELPPDGNSPKYKSRSSDKHEYGQREIVSLGTEGEGSSFPASRSKSVMQKKVA